MLYEDLQLLYFPIFLSPDGTAPLQGLQTFPSPTQLSKGKLRHILTYMHAYLHRCDIFDMLVFISFGDKSIFYPVWDLGGENITEEVRLNQILLVTRWPAGVSELQKRPAVKSWHPGTGQHGLLGDQCVGRSPGQWIFWCWRTTKQVLPWPCSLWQHPHYLKAAAQHWTSRKCHGIGLKKVVRG